MTHKPQTKSGGEIQSKLLTTNCLRHWPGLTPISYLKLPHPRASQTPPLRSHSHSTANKDVSTQKRQKTGEKNGWTHIREHLRTSVLVKNLGLIWKFSPMNVKPRSSLLLPEPSKCLLLVHASLEPQFLCHYLNPVSSFWKHLYPSSPSPGDNPYSENFKLCPSLNLEKALIFYPSSFSATEEGTPLMWQGSWFPFSPPSPTPRHPQC